METTLTGQADRTPIPYEERAEFWAEKVYLATSEMVSAYKWISEREGVNREVIADRLERDKGQISRLLNGQRNLTIRLLSEMALAMEHNLQIEIIPFTELAIPNYSFTVGAEVSGSSGRRAQVSDTLAEEHDATRASVIPKTLEPID